MTAMVHTDRINLVQYFQIFDALRSRGIVAQDRGWDSDVQLRFGSLAEAEAAADAIRTVVPAYVSEIL